MCGMTTCEHCNQETPAGDLSPFPAVLPDRFLGAESWEDYRAPLACRDCRQASAAHLESTVAFRDTWETDIAEFAVTVTAVDPELDPRAAGVGHETDLSVVAARLAALDGAARAIAAILRSGGYTESERLSDIADVVRRLASEQIDMHGLYLPPDVGTVTVRLGSGVRP